MKYEHDGSGALPNLPVTSMPSTAHEAYVCVHGTCSGVHEKSHAKVSLLRRAAQGCLVVGSSPRGKVCSLQDANAVPGSVKAVSQSALIRVTCRTRVPGEDLELFSRAPAVFVRAKSFSVGAARDFFKNSGDSSWVEYRWETKVARLLVTQDS